MTRLNSPDKKPTSSPVWSGGLGLIAALLIILALMLGSIYYPYPNGKPLDIWGFIALWAYEIIAVGLSMITTAVLLIVGVVRRIRSKSERSQNAR